MLLFFSLSLSSQYCWRWTGFNFGLDLLVTYTNRFIVFKRNTLSQPCGGVVSLQPRRHLAYRSVVHQHLIVYLKQLHWNICKRNSKKTCVECNKATGFIFRLQTLEKPQPSHLTLCFFWGGVLQVETRLLRQSWKTGLQPLDRLPAAHPRERPGQWSLLQRRLNCPYDRVTCFKMSPLPSGVRGDEPGQPVVIIPALRVL